MSYRPVHHHSRPCVHCGTPYTPRRRDAKYCSSSCCTAAHYALHGRPETRASTDEEAQKKQPKPASFGKMVGAAATAQVAVEVAQQVLDIGNAARLNRIEQQVRQIHRKLDALTPIAPVTAKGLEGLKPLLNAEQSRQLTPAKPMVSVRSQEPVRQLRGNTNGQGAQFDPKDILM